MGKKKREKARVMNQIYGMTMVIDHFKEEPIWRKCMG